MGGRLWDKGASGPSDEQERALARLVERFTVGNDPEVDAHILADDCLGSIAHAAGLRRAGILSSGELRALRDELLRLVATHQAEGVPITRHQEDCHTAIEAHLTEALGDLGKKIHTGRSRNDQVLTALRLHNKRRILDVAGALRTLTRTLLRRAAGSLRVPMRGYTHTQPAMPTTLGAFLASHGEALLDDADLLRAAFDHNDRCPLGSAAGFGSVIPIDRQYTSDLLGFSRVQVSAMACQSGRGKAEGAALHALEAVQGTLGRLASDLILFVSREFGFMSLPDLLTTGSSIMPQKRNPDVLELVRAREGVVSGAAEQVRAVSRKLISGYHRDYQLLKDPIIRALAAVQESLVVMDRVVLEARFHEEALAASCTREIYAADMALDKARQGIPFREAYRVALEELEGVTIDRTFVQGRIDAYTTLGSMGNPGLDLLEDRLVLLTAWIQGERRAREQMLDRLGAVQ